MKTKYIKCTKEDKNKILKGIKKDISYRERFILDDLKEVIKKDSVPEGYFILEFYASNGEGFEAGLTPHGYSITC